jgi:membrane protease YdiL (CAAX protease family)
MRILLAAFISEGILLILSLAISLFADIPLIWNSSWWAVLVGFALIIPPLIVNNILWRYSETNHGSIFYRFSQEIIIPLCRHITPTAAIIVAILSGVCEEMFFRGALNSLCARLGGIEFAFVVSSLIFAATHFIGSFKKYGAMIPLYTAMGAYLWLVHFYSDSLTAVAICHGAYNLVVILITRRRALT